LRTIAHIISFIFHPLLLSTYLLFILGYYFPILFGISPQSFKLVLAFVFCFTFLLPAVNMLMFRHFGTIQSYALHERSQRYIPSITITVIYLVMTLLFYFRLPISANFIKIITLLTALAVVGTLVTFFYKISLHSLGMWGAIGILLPLNKGIEENTLLWPTALAIVGAGMVMSARLYLNAHTLPEVLYGGLAGFIIGFGGIIFLF
jgi:membrane-associated phospholipid phosphatase